MEYKVSKIKLSPEIALQKMRNWCAYQERSQYEALQKLTEMGLSIDEANEIIASLITENYMNEERFTLAFAGGKFRIKQWGKNKIKAELRKHKVPENMINKAFMQIDDDEYKLTLQKIITKRLEASGTKDAQIQFFDALKYCITRGFEHDLVNELLKLHIKR